MQSHLAAQASLAAAERQFRIDRVAICGAGVMGAQIAAHCANAGVPVVLFDLPAQGGDKSATARQAIDRLRKLNPAPLGAPDVARLIRPANYDDDLALLGECDLVIEAIAERLDWKRDLYHRIAPVLGPQSILATNTSGLSIRALADALPAFAQERFCGLHFFNPPRYMHLVELIAAPKTHPDLLDRLETFLVSRLGKGVLRARDTPNFIGNRIGVFGIVSVMRQAERFGLTIDVVDQLTGTRLGRAKSGTFRTADVVGLDTLAHVLRTMQEHLRDDPFHSHFRTPAVLSALLDNGALGQKAGAGFYRKEGKTVLRLDPASGRYVPADGEIDEGVAAILAEPDPTQRLDALRNSDHPQAQFVWAVLRDSFHYSAVHLADIANTARQVDLAMRWGFGHAMGPFEIWQAAGWHETATAVTADIRAGRAMADVPLPDWALRGPVWEARAVHTVAGSWNPTEKRYEGRSRLPVYQRQVGTPLVLGETAEVTDADVRTAAPTPVQEAGHGPSGPGLTVHETGAVRCWILPPPHPQDVLILSFKTKLHTLSPDVVEGVLDAIDRAEDAFKGLVVGHVDDPFSAGADLKAMLPLFEQGGPAAVEPFQKRMQHMALRLRYAKVPVVAAVAGLVLGGGCELAVHCARRVAHFETWMGLVEAGIGLVPGAGGLTFSARRAAERRATAAPDAPLLPFLKEFAASIAGARVSNSALEARQMGFLDDADPIVMNRYELLFVAARHAAALGSFWSPPSPATFPVAGRDGAATLTAQLVNLREGGFISDHDFLVAQHAAQVLCGGDVDAESLVDEQWMMAQERKAFLSLLIEPKTQERIVGMLKTGKPVRN